MLPLDAYPEGAPAETPLAQQLRLAIAPLGGAHASRLAYLLAELVDGHLSVDGVRERVLADPDLNALLKALAGHRAETSSTTVAFGQGSQIGDVTIRDIIGGNQFQLNIYHAPASAS
ncbi:MAG: hypothetical protein WCI67_05610, partial [Chloroflexales bacterium]